MKRFIFYTLIASIFALKSWAAISIPTTSNNSYWTGLYTVSNLTYYGQDATKPWSPTLPALPGGTQTFLSINANWTSSASSVVYGSITGLTVNSRYKLTYYVSTAVRPNVAVNIPFSDFASGYEMDVYEGGVAVGGGVASTKLDFSPGINTGKWLIQTIEFVATANIVKLGIFAKSSSHGLSHVNFHIGSTALEEICPIAGTTVSPDVNRLWLKCPSSTVDLTKAYTGGIPGNSEVVWYRNAVHSGSPVADPTKLSEPGDYYAFFKEKSLQCFGTDNSTAKVIVASPKVLLNSDTGKILCAGKTYDLTKLVSNTFVETPDLSVIRWFKNPNHLGVPISDPAAVGPGTYYAFFYFGSHLNCYDTDNSTAKVVVSESGQVDLGYNSASVICPTGVAPLPTGAGGAFEEGQAGKYLRYFLTNDHTGYYYSTGLGGTPVAVINDYYVFVYDEAKDCYNVPISTEKFAVKQLPDPTLSKTKLAATCPTKTVDLTKTPTNPDTRYRWFTNATHSGSPIADPTAINKSGSYYLFRYDADQNCYNTDISNAKVDVVVTPCVTGCLAGTDQVMLQATSKSNVCPANTVNLVKVWNQVAPAGTAVAWFDNPNHTGTAIFDPTKATAGTYYAFFYDATNSCYNTDNSTAKVTVTINACGGQCAAGTEQVKEDWSSGAYVGYPCKTTLDLTTFNSEFNSPPVGASIVWYLDPNHTNPVSNPQAVGIGSYYAFYYDAVNNCFNTDNSTAKVFFQEREKIIVQPNISNVCPATTVDLNSIVADEYTESDQFGVAWFTNNSHQGSPVNDPGHAQAGVYYAFDQIYELGCYTRSGVSTDKVTVTTKACAGVVQLSLKIALQGSMPGAGAGTTMRNNLQTYTDGMITGVLPKTDPYGNGAIYNDINNTAVIAGNVVDWVKVDIKSTSAPYTILQSKSLLLRTDGSIVDVDGLIPNFNVQVGNVYVVVRHRNHLAIMSNSTPFVAGPLSIDFTDNLNKAFNDGSVPDQMKLINGIWCMVNGDVNQDNFIQNNDISQTRNSYKQGGVGVYSSRDLNMNCFLENLDATAQRNRFQTGFTSILSKY